VPRSVHPVRCRQCRSGPTGTYPQKLPETPRVWPASDGWLCQIGFEYLPCTFAHHVGSLLVYVSTDYEYHYLRARNQKETMSTPASPPIAAETNVKCPFCAEVIAAAAKKCKHCGEFLDESLQNARMPTPRSNGLSVSPNEKTKVTAGLLAIFLGGLGMHKFYLGRVGQGIVYILLCWTLIPSVIGFIEGIIYLMMSDQAFAEKYGMALRSNDAIPLGAQPDRAPYDPKKSVFYKLGGAWSQMTTRSTPSTVAQPSVFCSSCGKYTTSRTGLCNRCGKRLA
jgi:TM2 domain-containing membrane protein YozV